MAQPAACFPGVQVRDAGAATTVCRAGGLDATWQSRMWITGCWVC